MPDFKKEMPRLAGRRTMDAIYGAATAGKDNYYLRL